MDAKQKAGRNGSAFFMRIGFAAIMKAECFEVQAVMNIIRVC